MRREYGPGKAYGEEIIIFQISVETNWQKYEEIRIRGFDTGKRILSMESFKLRLESLIYHLADIR